jgi:pimeloyl-ACP methyl ester carboxylesterase
MSTATTTALRRCGLGVGAAALAAGSAQAGARHVAWRRRMAGLRATYEYADPGLPSTCGPLAARRSGDRGTPVLLVHGLGGSSRSWGAGYDATLAPRHRVVAPDLLGFGRSPRPDGAAYTVAQQADLLAECLAAAGADDEPAVVAAHSYGVAVAVTLLRRHPALVRGIVGVAPPLFRDSDHARAQMLRALTPVERVLAMDTPWARRACRAICCRRPRLASWLARSYRLELPEAIAVDGVLHSWTSYSRSLAELLGATGRAEWAAQGGVPVHMLCGERDRLPDPAYLEQVAPPGGRVVVERFPHGDHVLHLSHPARCLEIIEGLASGCDTVS